MAIANNASMPGLNPVGKPLISVGLSVATERQQGRDGVLSECRLVVCAFYRSPTTSTDALQ